MRRTTGISDLLIIDPQLHKVAVKSRQEEKNTLTGTTNHKTIYLCSTFKERCQSDRMGRTRNPVNGLSVPWV